MTSFRQRAGQSSSFARLRLEIFPAPEGGFFVRTHSPDGGEGNAPLTFPCPLAEVESLARTNPGLAGEMLFGSLFQGQTLSLYEGCINRLERVDGAFLRLELIFDPHDAKLVPLQALPWELMRRPGSPEVIALNRRTSLVRYLTVPYPVRAATQPKTLRVLVVAADPRLPGSSLLDLEGERMRLEAALAGSPEIELVPLPGAQTLAAVRNTLVEQGCHVLHFMGHGGRQKGSAEQVLYFEGDRRAADPVSGSALATKLSDLPSLRLVVLNACESGRVPKGSESVVRPLDGVATSLVLGRLPAVIAMQRAISDSAAIAWSGTFYRRLAAGDTIDAAIAEGRQAMDLADRESFEWATPVSFLRTATGELFPEKDLAPEGAPRWRKILPKGAISLVLLLLLVGVFAPRLVDEVTADSNHESWSVARKRIEEARNLARAREKEQIQYHTLQLKSDDPTARRHAAENLVPYGKDAAQEIVKAISEEAGVIASKMIKSITGGNFLSIISIFGNEKPWQTPFMEEASNCLVQIGEASTPLIVDELAAESAEAERISAEAERISTEAEKQQSQQDLSSTFRLGTTLLSTGREGMKVSIMREVFGGVLLEIGPPAVPNLLEGLAHPRILVKQVSLQVLSQIPEARERTIKRLRQIADSIGNPAERTAYLEAAQQLEQRSP